MSSKCAPFIVCSSFLMGPITAGYVSTTDRLPALKNVLLYGDCEATQKRSLQANQTIVTLFGYSLKYHKIGENRGYTKPTPECPQSFCCKFNRITNFKRLITNAARISKKRYHRLRQRNCFVFWSEVFFLPEN